ncbi:MAG: ribonuclease HII [Thermoprotei archaeon]
MLIGGVDEAGRGPVLGPMIIALIVSDESTLEKFRDYGIKDSKKLSPSKRKELYNIIKNEAKYVLSLKIEPYEIDDAVLNGHKLAILEAKKIAELINKINVADVIYIDAAHSNANYFSQLIQSNLIKKIRIVCEHNADERYIPVGAASIIAKIERDEIIENLKRIYGDFGSGYPSDPKTINFLKQWIRVHNDLPPFARKSWVTVKRLMQRSLDI